MGDFACLALQHRDWILFAFTHNSHQRLLGGKRCHKRRELVNGSCHTGNVLRQGHLLLKI